MDEKIYLHAIYYLFNRYNPDITYERLKNILKSDAILSRRMQCIYEANGFNGLDYISICDYEKRNIIHPDVPDYTAYNLFIRESLSIIFPKGKFEVITPKILKLDEELDKKTYDETSLGTSSKERYSDIYDEVQAQDKIPLNLMSGITFPLHKMNSLFVGQEITTHMVIHELKRIKKLLLKYGYDVPFYDIDTKIPLDDEERVKKLVKYYYKKSRSKL